MVRVACHQETCRQRWQPPNHLGNQRRCVAPCSHFCRVTILDSPSIEARFQCRARNRNSARWSDGRFTCDITRAEIGDSLHTRPNSGPVFHEVCVEEIEQTRVGRCNRRDLAKGVARAIKADPTPLPCTVNVMNVRVDRDREKDQPIQKDALEASASNPLILDRLKLRMLRQAVGARRTVAAFV